jgi:LacI family transcriptional regulator
MELLIVFFYRHFVQSMPYGRVSFSPSRDRLSAGDAERRSRRRRSTETLVVSDPDVASALRYIREHAYDGIRVSDVVRHVAMSSSTLKRRFAETIGRPPKAEILRVRLERIKHLLRSTDLPLDAIAPRAGFDDVHWMCKLFKSKTGQTPGIYRSETRT